MANLFKALPAEYLYAGYNVRKGISVMSKVENGHMVYDLFSYVYLDDKLSLYYLMDDGNYKNPDLNKNIDEIKIEDLVSRHIGNVKDIDEEETQKYDKNEVIGVFGLRKIDDLMTQIDKYEEKIGTAKLKIQAIYDLKKSYTGLEINNIIGRWNKDFSKVNGPFTVPAIVNGIDDNFKSIIGDELDYFDLVSNKSSDEIVEELRNLSFKLDGVGNIK